MNMDKIKAAKERLKKHSGGENLKLIDSSERARELQKKGVEARKRNQERLQMTRDFLKDIDVLADDVSKAPKGIDVLKYCMVQAMHDGKLDLAAQYADKLAAYETPKKASVVSTNLEVDVKDLTEEELEAKLKALEDGDEV